MSKIIKSNRVNLSEASYKLSSDVFISKEAYIPKVVPDKEAESEDFSDEENAQNNASDSEYTAEALIEKAEAAAIEIMDNAQKLADNLIADARQSARELEEEAIENTNQVYENSRKKGSEEGYHTGYNEGYAEGKAMADELIAQAQAELEEVLAIKKEFVIKDKEFYIDKEAEMIKMVLEIAKKVIGKEIQEFDYIESLIKEAMKHLNYATDIVIRVSEYDFDAASFAKPKILAMAERIENLEIKIDYALSHGSLMIDTNTGSIDASVKTQLESIEDMFMNILATSEKEFKEEEENAELKPSVISSEAENTPPVISSEAEGEVERTKQEQYVEPQETENHDVSEIL